MLFAPDRSVVFLSGLEQLVASITRIGSAAIAQALHLGLRHGLESARHFEILAEYID